MESNTSNTSNDNKKEVSFTNPVLEENVSNKVSISKDDLKIILNILIVCAKRNAFELEEYKVIGELNNRLKLLDK